MSRRRAERKLRLELLRARAAADRIELSVAVRDISERLDPIRRAADSIGSVAAVLGGRGRTLGWAAAAVAALVRSGWLRRTVGAVRQRRAARRGPRARNVALSALVAGLIALLLGRARAGGPQAEGGDEEPPTG
jgi:hypothetical protein